MPVTAVKALAAVTDGLPSRAGHDWLGVAGRGMMWRAAAAAAPALGAPASRRLSGGPALRHPIVYLHGFGQQIPRDCRVLAALRQALPEGHDPQILHPSYHPRLEGGGGKGDVQRTDLEPFLHNLYHSIVSRKIQVARTRAVPTQFVFQGVSPSFVFISSTITRGV